MKAYEGKSINGEVLRSILISGANNLFNHYPEVDALNVFPVPDGDTGTNMNLTITSGSKEIMNIRNDSIGEVGKIFSRGLLMGARGNSGVILSQIFRGFAQKLEGLNEINILEFAEAWKAGSDKAYKAVMRPVEGTILTVIRESSSYLLDKLATVENIGQAMECILQAAKESLKRTPELLPVLKEVGVVDSGGAGLVLIMEGMLLGLKGEIIERKQISMPQVAQEIQPSAQAKLESEEFGYNTEFALRLSEETLKKGKFDQNRFTALLQSLGHSLEVVRDGDIIKVHLHTLKPGVALNYAQLYGEFVVLKIENMQEQNTHLEEEENKPTIAIKVETVATKLNHAKQVEPEPRKKYGLIVVSVGDGLEEMFKSSRVDYIVSGGQSMNPSTNDFIDAISHVNAEHIYILPNNKNIIMAAKQAAAVCENCQVHVIPTRTILQGLTACMMFNPDVDEKTNEKEMLEAAKRVRSGQVTFAIKDTEIDHLKIKKDYFMGILETKNIVSCRKELDDACYELLDHMIDKNSSIVTIVYGDKVSEEEVQKLAEKIAEDHTIEVDVHYGGQPVYFYFFGVE